MTSSTPSRFAADARAICALGLPLLGNNLSIMGMQFADTVMAGQLGPRDLAALAVGVGYYHLFLLFGLGVLMAVSPSVAHAYGANDKEQVTRYCRQAWWIALALAVLLVTGLWQVASVLPALGIAPEILPTAIGYVHAMSFGMPALLGFLALRNSAAGVTGRRSLDHRVHHSSIKGVERPWASTDYTILGSPGKDPRLS